MYSPVLIVSSGFSLLTASSGSTTSNDIFNSDFSKSSVNFQFSIWGCAFNTSILIVLLMLISSLFISVIFSIS